MSVATILDRPAGFMLETLRMIREGISNPTRVDRPLRPLEARGVLLGRSSSLSEWSREHGYSLTQVSLALHGRRKDRRSREILTALKNSIGAMGRFQIGAGGLRKNGLERTGQSAVPVCRLQSSIV